MEFKNYARGYANLWATAKIKPERRASALAIAKKLLSNKARYQKISVQVGDVPWWWIAAIHNMESSGNFSKYLGNGQWLTQKTTIEPKGRGPFPSFEAGAVDAIKLKGLQNIKTWDIPRALFEAERYNGWGYFGRIASPYVWSFTNHYTRGKYVEDHVYDANHVSSQCGVAAIFKALEEMGELKFTDMEDNMAELRASLLPFGGLAPILIRTLAGPAASLAVKALAEAFDDDKPEPKADVVAKKLEEVNIRQVPGILAAAEEILKEVLGDVPDDHQPVPAAPVLTPTTTTTTVTNAPVDTSPPKLGIVDRIFGGQFLAGLKTPIGIILYCLAWGGSAFAPEIFTQEVVSGLNALATGFVGVGLTAKLDWFLSWLKPFAKR